MVDLRMIVMAPALIALVMAGSVILNALTAELFTSLDSSSNILYPNIIKVVIGILPLILVLGIVWYVWSSTQAQAVPPPEYQ